MNSNYQLYENNRLSNQGFILDHKSLHQAKVVSLERRRPLSSRFMCWLRQVVKYLGADDKLNLNVKEIEQTWRTIESNL